MEELLSSGVNEGVLRVSDDGGARSRQTVTEQITKFVDVKRAREKPTLFVGSAVSIFQPSQLPLWNGYITSLWTKVLDATNINPSGDFTKFLEQTNQPDLPNYLVTEAVARRLGQDYLQVLDAFNAEKSPGSDFPRDGHETYCVNTVHKWIAKCLVSGVVASVVTTNFDDYLERAVESMHGNCYRVTGDPHQDGVEISKRQGMVKTDKKLVLIVSGSKAFAFVRSLLPQLGRGEFTFLFKLHGSCYDPLSCVDTRLQRSQGLPSFATNVLDWLLRRTVFLVAGYSGLDCDENNDYLRFISNKDQASIVWLVRPNSELPLTVPRLVEKLDRGTDIRLGMCLLEGSFQGTTWPKGSKFSAFDQKLKDWADGLGPDWNKLVILDIISLICERKKELSAANLLQRLWGEKSPRQDWNDILRGMRFPADNLQAKSAQACFGLCTKLRRILTKELAAEGSEVPQLYQDLNEQLRAIGAHYVQLEDERRGSGKSSMHAQSWVLPALSGLALLVGGRASEANRALELAKSVSWTAGDFESYGVVNGVVKAMAEEQMVPAEAVGQAAAMAYENPARRDGEKEAKRRVVLSASLDKENASMNRYGLPPDRFMRAMLHRSIMFADGIVLSLDMLVNSSVFLDEVLFQGKTNRLNETYANHIFPLLPDSVKEGPGKLVRVHENRDKSYIREEINKNHLSELDKYFDKEENAKRITYYKETNYMQDYGNYVRQEVADEVRDVTISHLTDLWDYAEADGGWKVKRTDSRGLADAKDAAQEVVRICSRFTGLLPEGFRRSYLYSYAGLSQDFTDQNYLGWLKSNDGTHDNELKNNRDRLIREPWLFGPFCRELFDAPYRAVGAFDYAAKAGDDSYIFLGDDERPSWRYIAAVCQRSDKLTSFSPDEGSYTGQEYSASLISQMSEFDLLTARSDLKDFRDEFFTKQSMSDENLKNMREWAEALESRCREIPTAEIMQLEKLPPSVQKAALTLLEKSIFLVRRGPALDPMYEEAQITFPGLLVLRRNREG